MDITIQPASLEFVESFREAPDNVARERQFLDFTEAPPLDDMKRFVSKIIEKGWNQFYADSGGQVIGWYDILRSEDPAFTHCGTLGIGVLL